MRLILLCSLNNMEQSVDSLAQYPNQLPPACLPSSKHVQKKKITDLKSI
jgi:hypothetical protein